MWVGRQDYSDLLSLCINQLLLQFSSSSNPHHPYHAWPKFSLYRTRVAVFEVACKKHVKTCFTFLLHTLAPLLEGGAIAGRICIALLGAIASSTSEKVVGKL